VSPRYFVTGYDATHSNQHDAKRHFHLVPFATQYQLKRLAALVVMPLQAHGK
jgi:hypothetical protein